MSKAKRKISFVISCYYSEKTVADVINRIEETVLKDGRYDYEIICVNDGSTDGTYAVLRTLAETQNKIKIIDLSRNFGQHAALMAGFHYVTGDIIVCLDDDGQNPPEEMFKLIEKCEEGYDLVSAKYSEKDKRGIIRSIGSRISFAMSRSLIDMPKDIELNSYYCMKRFVVDEIIRYNNPYPLVHGLALRVTKNMANVELRRDERAGGQSGYNLKKLIGLWMNGFTAFSAKPLRIASFLGIITALIGILFAIIIVIRKLTNSIQSAGYASTIAIILTISGIIMIFLGLLGEYIGRIYISINNAPQYVIRSTKNIEKEMGVGGE